MIILALLICFPSIGLGQKKNSKARPQTTAKAAPGDKEFKSGETLFDQGTETSLKSALQQFLQATSLYEQTNNRKKLVEAVYYLGKTYRKLNNLDQAIQSYTRADKLFEELGDNGGRADILNNLGAILRDIGQFDKALAYYQQALPLYRLTKYKEGEAYSLNGIGECYLGLANLPEASKYVRQAYDIWETQSNNQDKVRTTFNLGRISFAYGDAQNGLSYLNKALTESRQFNNPVLEGDILESLADYYVSNGELTKAIDYRKRIFDAYTNEKAWSVSVTRKLTSVNNLIVSYYRAGDFQSANQYLDRGINIGKQYNEMVATAILIGNKGVIQVDQGNYDEGMQLLNQGIIASRQSNNKFTEAYFLASLGFAQSETGENQEAINSLNQALQIVPAGASPEVEGKILSGLIKVYADMENKGKANEMIRLAASRKIDTGLNAGAVQVLEAAGYAEYAFGNSKGALPLLNQAFTIAARLNHEVEKAKILYVASLVYQELNDYQNALKAVQTSHDFWKKVGNQSMDMETHYQMGLIFQLAGQGQSAIEQFNTVLAFPANIGMEETRAGSHLFLGLIYLGNKDYQASIENYNQANTMFENLGDKSNQKTALNGLAEAYEKSGDKKQAKTFRDKAKKIKN